MINYYSVPHTGGVAVIPNCVLENKRYTTLTWSAKGILTNIVGQYRGHNNGDLCATLSVFKKYGLTSQDTLTKAIKQLEKNGLIERTRQGGKDWATGANLPTLYSITWQPIDECNGKLDVGSTTKPAVDFIKEWKNITRS